MLKKNRESELPTSGRFESRLLKFLQDYISSHSFLEAARSHPQAFSRNRCLTLPTLVLFFLHQVKGSLQTELNQFFSLLYGFKHPFRVVTKGAFTRARKKLKSEALKILNLDMLRFFYANGAPKLWHGHRLLAIDGSTAKLPFLNQIGDHFGYLKCSRGQRPRPMARVSQLYDLLNKVSLDVILAPYRQVEKTLADQHANHLKEGDLVVLDRGYPAFWLARRFQQSGADFCFRIRKGFNVVSLLEKLGRDEALIMWRPTKGAKRKCRAMALPSTPILVRVIRYQIRHNQSIFLMTTLTDFKKYPYQEMIRLYRMRWRVEEDYKILKERMELMNFTGKSVQAIMQDVQAKTLTKNLASLLTMHANDKIKETYASAKYNRMINVTQVLSLLKQSLVLLLSTNSPQLLSAVQASILQMLDIVRPDRSFPRYPGTRKPVKLKGFHMAYKRTS